MDYLTIMEEILREYHRRRREGTLLPIDEETIIASGLKEFQEQCKKEDSESAMIEAWEEKLLG